MLPSWAAAKATRWHEAGWRLELLASELMLPSWAGDLHCLDLLRFALHCFALPVLFCSASLFFAMLRIALICFAAHCFALQCFLSTTRTPTTCCWKLNTPKAVGQPRAPHATLDICWPSWISDRETTLEAQGATLCMLPRGSPRKRCLPKPDRSHPLFGTNYESL